MPDRAVRIACRDAFRRSNILAKLIPGIEDVLRAGEIAPPEEPDYAVGPAFADPGHDGDEGHR